MDEFEKRKIELFKPILFQAGAGLLDSQNFEYALKYLMYLLSKIPDSSIETASIEKILDGDIKKTAGQLVSSLKKSLPINMELEEILFDSLNARNILVHSYLTDNIERMAEKDNQKGIVSEILHLRKRINKGHNSIKPLIHILAKDFDNIDIEYELEKNKITFMTQFEI